jgi:hypothetical protein
MQLMNECTPGETPVIVESVNPNLYSNLSFSEVWGWKLTILREYPKSTIVSRDMYSLWVLQLPICQN